MAHQITHAKPGNRFVLTYTGKHQEAIRVKFQDRTDSIYFKQVPRRWITDGYVVEVKESEEE